MTTISQTLTAPPIDDPRRQREQMLRDSFWDGDWEETLKSDLKKALGADRAEALGVIDMSCCLGPQISRELAVCHVRPPLVTRSGAEPRLVQPGGPIEKSLLWSMMPEFTGRVCWLREYIMRLEMSTAGDLVYRPVPPWLTEMKADPANPSQPIVYSEWVPRLVEGSEVWTRDVIDLTGEEPSMRVLSQDGLTDLTKLVFRGSQSGKDYWARWQDGKPWMPVELYHRDPDAALWHCTQGVEMVAATRMAAVLWSMFCHNYRDAAHEQRVIIDGTPIGAAVKQSSQGARYITPDATLILLIDSLDGKQAQIDQWRTGADPGVLLTGLQGYLAQATGREGVSPAELQRLSGDPQSGYAIALNNEGKRAAQRRFGPQWRARDESLLCKSAAAWNRWHTNETPYSEDGYQVAYQGIPLSAEEERSLREQIDWELDKGWITPAQGLARLRGISESEAKQIIIANQAAEAETPNLTAAGGEE
jgi:hypothetical protein